MTRNITACCALLVLAAGGAAQGAALGDNMVKLAPSLLKLPQNIGPLRYSGEKRYSDRRLGRSFGYDASGISLTIYVYDYGDHGVTDGPDSVAACEQFEDAKRDIEGGDNYQNVALRHEVARRMKDVANAPLAREALYEFDRKDIHVISLLWLTAADGHFVKLRLSLRSELADELDEARLQVLEALANSFAARPARPMAPAQSGSQKMEVEFDASADPADAAPWLAYAAELTRRARAQPQMLPRCGGPLVPGFAAELAARQAALSAYQARATEAHTTDYFEQLARAGAAGFLDEYVWYYLRDASWGAAPDTLNLTGFEAFRARELATHVPYVGAHVRVIGVRPLPLEPAP